MPWFLPLLLLAAGTGMQYKAEKRRKVATERGIMERRRAEDARQQGFEQKVQAARAEAGQGISAEDQSAVERSAAAEREALAASRDVKAADAGYQNPSLGDTPRVVRTDADRVAQAADAFVANQGAARNTLAARGDAQRAEAMRLAPIARQIARQQDFAARSAALLPNEIQTAIAQGAAKGRKTAMGGQLLSTLGTMMMASPQFAQGVAGLFGGGAGSTALPSVVAESATPGATSAMGGMQMSLAPANPILQGSAISPQAALAGQVDALLPSTTAYLRSIGRAAPRVF